MRNGISSALVIGCVVMLSISSYAFSEKDASASSPSKLPVGLIGASYGGYEIRILTNNIIIHSKDETYLFKNLGVDIPWNDLDKYSLLIVATAVKTPATPAQMEKLRKYVENGGHLMLVRSIVRSICGGWKNLQKGKWFQWAGIKTVLTLRKKMDAEIPEPMNPLLKGVLKATSKENGPPAWPVPVYSLYVVTEPMRVLVGKGERALIATAKIGKGRVTVFGEELFRKRGKKPKADAAMYLKIMLNTVRAANPATQKEMMNKLGEIKAQKHAGVPVLIWDREWTRGERYGPRFEPPLPSDDELVDSLDVDMAIDEYESVQLNLTPLKELKRVSWSLDTGKFPRKNVEFLVQAKPKPIKWKKNPTIAKEFPYWLMPPERIAPEGSSDFTLFPKYETRVVWVRINTKDVKPGSYVLNLTLRFEGGFSRKIPLKVKVYPVTLPQHRLITLAAAGQVYGDANKPAPALRFAKNLEAHGVEWSKVNAYRPWLYGIIGTNSKLKGGYLRKHKEQLVKGPLPMIDFSCLDPWMEQAIGHGLTKFKIGTPHRYFGLPLKRGGIEDPALRTRLTNWFLSEISRYMREKGVGTLICSTGDELSLKELKGSWKPWAERLHSAGWDCSSTFSFRLKKKDCPFINEISKYVKLWTFNRSIVQYFITLKKDGLIKLRKDAIIGTYGAGEGRGSEHRKPLGRSRMLGWESWYEGIQDCQVNPYFKSWIYYCDYGDRGESGGIGGERFVSYIDAKDLSAPVADCPFWEGVRDGMDDGNLAAILSWYIKELKKAGGKPAKLAKKAEKELAKVIEPSPNSILKVKSLERSNRHSMRIVSGSKTAFKKAKKRVLELLESLSGTAKTAVKPSLYWNTTPLVVSGKATAAICGTEKDAAALQKEIVRLSGMKLPVIAMNADTAPSGIKTIIAIGNGTQNAFSAKALKENGVANASAAYPGKGSYFIKTLKKGATDILLVAGPDAAGTTKGTAMFAKFLHSTGHWL